MTCLLFLMLILLHSSYSFMPNSNNRMNIRSLERINMAKEAKYQLVLIRHGLSTWNELNIFTGWADVPLSSVGIEEAGKGGELLLENGFKFDMCYTSLLKRAIKTLHICLESIDQLYLPVNKDWRLNERHYGGLQGLNKKETVDKHGIEQVNIWRRSYDIPPPAITDKSSEQYPGNEDKYKYMKESDIPLTESLKDTEARFMPYWNEEIVPQIKAGKKILISAHGNTLRALAKNLDDIPEDVISNLNIPTAVPLVYDLDEDLNPVASPLAIAPLKGYYLGNQEEIKSRIMGVANQTK